MSSSGKTILQLAWPLIVSFWMRSLFNFVDTGFAATIGDEAVAAIGLALPLEWLLIACWVGTSTGLTSLLSAALGGNQSERFDQVVRQTRRIIAVLIPLFGALGLAVWLFGHHLEDFGLAPGLVDQFRTYGSVIVLGTAVTGFWSIIPDSIIKAHHDMRATMWAGIWSNLLNVALNALFLFVFHWGIFGIAFSTVLGRFGGLAYALVIARRHERRRRAEAGEHLPGTYARPLRALARLAVPSALTFGLVGLESLAVNGFLTRSRDATASLAAFTIYGRYVLFFSMPIIATGVALLPFTGRHFGRRDFAGIRAGFRQVALAASAYTLLLVLPVTWFLRRPLVAAFSEEAFTEQLAQRAMMFVPLACLVSIPFFACRPIFEGLQRGAPGLVVALLRYGLLTVPLVLLGQLVARRLGVPDLDGVLAGLVAATLLASAVLLFWMRAVLAAQESAAAPLTEVPREDHR